MSSGATDGALSKGMRRLARLVPARARARAKDAVNRLHAARAHRRWDHATVAAGPLDAAHLAALDRRYPVHQIDYAYTADAVLQRGIARREAVESLVAPDGTTLEIGSADGMTSAELARSGRRATAIDIDVSRTDPRVRAAGVYVQEMDATRLAFADATFDLVFSFNVFEHLRDPAAAFAEIARVLRPGGMAYLSFTGLRWSPHGAHLYKTLGVPYVTILFDEADVRAYLRTCGRSDWSPWVNDYSIERFREVFRSHTDTMDTLHYSETWNRWHARVIAAYPDVFKARAPSFESLLVDSILARFRRRHSPSP